MATISQNRVMAKLVSPRVGFSHSFLLFRPIGAYSSSLRIVDNRTFWCPCNPSQSITTLKPKSARNQCVFPTSLIETRMEGKSNYLPFGERKGMHSTALTAKNESSDDSVVSDSSKASFLKSSSTEVDFVVDEENWRDHPSIPETFSIPSIDLPSKNVHNILVEAHQNGRGILSPFLVSNAEVFNNVHPRMKLVRDLPYKTKEQSSQVHDETGRNTRKAILLDPSTVFDRSSKKVFQAGEQARMNNELHQKRSSAFKLLESTFPGMNPEVLSYLSSCNALPGPTFSITLDHNQQTVHSILSKILPDTVQPPPTGFEQIGHVVHLNLKSHHLPYRKIVGSVILECLSPTIETVVNKVGEVSGPYRTYDMEVLAGKQETTVTMHEDGIKLQFDLRKVYWCTRLSGERSRLLEEDFRSGQIIADAFCGVGALCVLATTKLGCTIYANDLNPEAVNYCRNNAKGNGVWPRKLNMIKPRPGFYVSCMDAFRFIQNLGMLPMLPHHIIMNYPLDSASFLSALRGWPIFCQKTDQIPIVHLYTFARADDASNIVENQRTSQTMQQPPRDAINVAIDIVADGLISEGRAIEKSRYQRRFLDSLGCNVRAKEVRDVAPGKAIIYVSFKVTRELLKIMQGPFEDD